MNSENPSSIPPLDETPDEVIPVVAHLDLAPKPMANAIMEHLDYTPPATAIQDAEPAKPTMIDHVHNGLWHWILPSMFLLSMCVIILYATPYLVYHWRLLDAQADAESQYLKRCAELKADAEHADARLDVLDKRVHLTSLGFREVARKVLPNVVNVANYRDPKRAELGVFAKKNIVHDPDNDQKYVQSGVGSGLIIKPGVILTNYHVIKGSQRLRVSFASGLSIGIDPDAVSGDAITDLAIIKLPANLPAGIKDEAQQVATFADSDKDVQVGDWAACYRQPARPAPNRHARHHQCEGSPVEYARPRRTVSNRRRH